MNMKRGQLFLLHPDSEGKQRIVAIVSRNELNGGHSVTAVPFYSSQFEKRKDLDYCVVFYGGEGNLDKNCVAKTDELGRIMKTEFDLVRGSIGSFDEAQMKRLEVGIRWTLFPKG